MPLFNNNNKNNCNEKVIIKTVSESLTHPITLKSSSTMLQEEDYFLKPSYVNQYKQQQLIKSSQSDLLACEKFSITEGHHHDQSSIKLTYAKKNNLSRSFSNIITSVRNSLRFVRSTSPMPPGSAFTKTATSGNGTVIAGRSTSSFASLHKKTSKPSKTKSISPSKSNDLDNTLTVNQAKTNTSLLFTKKINNNNKNDIPLNTSIKDRTSRSTDNKRNTSSERVFFSLIRFNLERKFRKHKDNKQIIKNSNAAKNILSPNSNENEQFYSTISLNNLDRSLMNKSPSLMKYFDSRQKVSYITCFYFLFIFIVCQSS